MIQKKCPSGVLWPSPTFSHSLNGKRHPQLTGSLNRGTWSTQVSFTIPRKLLFETDRQSYISNNNFITSLTKRVTRWCLLVVTVPNHVRWISFNWFTAVVSEEDDKIRYRKHFVRCLVNFTKNSFLLVCGKSPRRPTILTNVCLVRRGGRASNMTIFSREKIGNTRRHSSQTEFT